MAINLEMYELPTQGYHGYPWTSQIHSDDPLPIGVSQSLSDVDEPDFYMVK
jgi:hypothetical protein